MALSVDLISQFVKMTKDETKKSSSTTVYGTVVSQDNSGTTVQLDGSSVVTPVNSTVKLSPGERVIVNIQNHTATVTGNLTSHPARTDDVDKVVDEINQFEIIVADELEAVRATIKNLDVENLDARYARIEDLEAEYAKIEDLEAEYATIEHLEAEYAKIENIEATYITAEQIKAEYATIDNLEATNAKIYNLEGVYGSFEEFTAEQLKAINATITNLDATYATIGDLEAVNATIENLDAKYLTADSAIIKSLTAGIAEIDTLIFGSASGGTIQTEFANAVIAQLGDAQIKSAMIQDLAASKITAGKINTNAVDIGSDDGRLLLSDETIQISDSSRVRVQIGKDASNDYSINIWDADGNLMFSEGGITDNAIKDSIIRDDMVSDDANISANKLDISSLFSVINGSTETIKSSRIFMDADAQTLDVVFKQMESDIDGLSDTVSSQGTSLSVVQGKINSKVWKEDIKQVEEDVSELSTQYSSLSQTVDSISSTVASHTTQISTKADKSVVESTIDKVSELEQNLEGFKITVSETYAEQDNVDKAWTQINQNKDNITSVAGRTTSVEGRMSTAETRIVQNSQSITSLVTRTEDIESEFDNYSTTAEMQAAINQSADGIEARVSRTYATKESVDNIEVGGRNLLINSSFTENLNSWDCHGVTIDVVDGMACATITGELGAVYTAKQSVMDKINADDLTQEYTFSADVKLSNYVAGTTNPFVKLYFSGYYDNNGTRTWFGATTVSGTDDCYRYNNQGWVRMVWTVKFPRVPTYALDLYMFARDFTGDLCFKNLKFEKGNKATDWTPAPEDIDNAISNNSESIYKSLSEQTTEIIASCEELILNASENYVKTGDYGTFVDKVEAALSVMSDNISIAFTKTERIEDVDGDLQDFLTTFSKYIKFTGETAITIGSGNSEITLEIDNETGISFKKNGEEFGWWDGVDFHTGNIVVEVNERAQFGNYAFVPRPDGSLSFLKVGG